MAHSPGFCNLCHKPVDVQPVNTYEGSILVYACVNCDRAKCGKCSTPIMNPKAKSCPNCGEPIRWSNPS